MFAKLLAVHLILTWTLTQTTIAEKAETPDPTPSIALDDLIKVESVPNNIAMLMNVLNSSQIYQVAPPIPSTDDVATVASEDYVILPQMNGEKVKFPYFVRITLLRIGHKETVTNVKNEDVKEIPLAKNNTPPVTRPRGWKPLISYENDHSHSPSPTPNGGGLILSGHLIHVLTVVLYIFFGLGLVLFIIHNCITCISIWLCGKDRVEQLPTRVRSSFRRRASTGNSNSFFVNKQQFYEPL